MRDHKLTVPYLNEHDVMTSLIGDIDAITPGTDHDVIDGWHHFPYLILVDFRKGVTKQIQTNTKCDKGVTPAQPAAQPAYLSSAVNSWAGGNFFKSRQNSWGYLSWAEMTSAALSSAELWLTTAQLNLPQLSQVHFSWADALSSAKISSAGPQNLSSAQLWAQLLGSKPGSWGQLSVA